MYDKIDGDVNKNLPLFLNNDLGIVLLRDFKELDNSKMDSEKAKKLAEYMHYKDLVSYDFNERCDITEAGYKVAGIGWLTYLSALEQIDQKEEEESAKSVNAQIRKEIQEEFIRRETIKKFRYDKWAIVISIIATVISIVALLLK